MKDLAEYIKILLLETNQVVVPEFGTFLVKRQPAYINDESIFPPVRVVDFVEDYSADDSKLLQYLELNQKISRLEASNKVQSLVKEIKEKHSTGVHYVWSDLGETYELEDGSIHFDRNKEYTFPSDSFGLNATPRMTKINNTNHDEEAISKAVPQLKIVSMENNNENNAVNDEKEAQKKNGKGKLAYLIILLGIIVVLLLLPKECVVDKLFNNQDKTTPTQIAPVRSGPDTSESVVPTTEEPQQRSKDSIANENTEEKDTLQKSKYTYHIIVASCINISDAEAQQFYLSKRGYKNIKIIKETDSRYRLSYTQYDNEEDAQVALLNISKNDEVLKDAWVLRKKN